MKTLKPKTNWLIDLLLFGGFLAAFWLDLTGLALHQLLGVLVGALGGYHLLAHSTWVKSVTAALRKGAANKQCRTFYALDIAVMAGLFLTVLNGVVISSWLDLPFTNYLAWRTFHVGVAAAALLLVVVKIGLHWRWIVGTARRHVFPAAPRLQPQALQPATVPVLCAPATGRVDRRDFIKLMGVVGVTATLTLGSALNNTLGSLTGALTSAAPLDQADTDADAVADLVAAQPVTQAAAQATQTVAATVAATTVAATATPVKATSSACVVRCNNHCSYPGRCRKYVDANNNKLCDLGECM